MAEHISFYLAQGFAASWFILALGTCFLSWAHYIYVGSWRALGYGGVCAHGLHFGYVLSVMAEVQD